MPTTLASLLVMPQAIRIDGTEVMRGKRHADLLADYMARENLTSDEVDHLIENGRIELGWTKLIFAPMDEQATQSADAA